MSEARNIDTLIAIMKKLRGKTGCPWDKAQTHDSLSPYLVEEAYEVLDAIEKRHPPQKLKEELGDLLLQIVFHSQLASEKKQFNFEDIAGSICEKLINRHPHVFKKNKKGSINTPDKVVEAWEKIKTSEGRKSLLDGIPSCLPALQKAGKLGQRAAKVGFDWKKETEILDKIKEEIKELREILAKKPSTERKKRIEDELGDIIFSAANLARFLGYDPEKCLRRTLAKFEKRFRYMEKNIADLERSTMREKEKYWQQAKTEA